MKTRNNSEISNETTNETIEDTMAACLTIALVCSFVKTFSDFIGIALFPFVAILSPFYAKGIISSIRQKLGLRGGQIAKHLVVDHRSQ